MARVRHGRHRGGAPNAWRGTVDGSPNGELAPWDTPAHAGWTGHPRPPGRTTSPDIEKLSQAVIRAALVAAEREHIDHLRRELRGQGAS